MTIPYPPMQPELLGRYLELLGVERERPGADALHRLVEAHACRVPFENVSKLYYKSRLGLRKLPGLKLYLDGIERFSFGGTCYSNNYYLYELLANLGYQAILCGADMEDPDVHLVSMVDVEARRYLVDVGYAAPFVAPLPCDLTIDHVVERGRDRYVLKPRDAQGSWAMESYRNGSLRHGYVTRAAPREIGEFETVIAYSYRPEATFMNTLLLARNFPAHSVVIRDLEVVESRGTTASVRALANPGDLVEAIVDLFGIPAEVTGEVVSALGPLGGT